jgi:AbrB family looped-hinge helix DNA binding protein
MAWYDSTMTARTTLDSAGRVVIPKALRDAMQLSAGDEVELESAGVEIILRPARPAPLLAKEQGVWVYRSGTAISAEAAMQLLDQVRQERVADLSS